MICPTFLFEIFKNFKIINLINSPKNLWPTKLTSYHESAIKRKKRSIIFDNRTKLSFMAGAEGIEPPITVLETVAIPFN